MLSKQKICESLNPVAACKKYEIPLWQCPQFLFVVMGVITFGVVLSTYLIGTQRIGDPTMVSLLVILIAATLLIISFVITSSLERLADASRMKTEFIGIVSHQLRAPLTNLRFSLDFLTSEKLSCDETSRNEYYQILKENTKRMGDLIDNLLTVSRIESGKFPLKKEKFALEAVVQRMLGKFQPFIHASNISVSFNQIEGLSNIEGDALWIEQVVENLLDNALKYTHGGGKVEISLRQKNKKLLFQIKDNGVGIPKREQKFIFEKFFRTTNALKQQTRGSGLGLHIVKKIITLSGGKIWFRSKEGKGTIFYFTLPVCGRTNHKS